VKFWHAIIPICVLLLYLVFGIGRLSRGEFRPDTSAIQSIKTIHIAEVQYSSMYDRYATSLAELGPPSSGSSSASAADIINAELARGRQPGYKFILSGNGAGYQITAVPMETGRRSFYSDQTMIIRENSGPEPATANSRELGSVRR
jgi:hypothetical protein